MEKFKLALNKFKNTCNSKFVEGKLIKSESQNSLDSNKVKFTEKLKIWYSDFNPNDLYIPWTAEDLMLYSIEELYDCQYGYRWYPDSTNEIEGWDKSWLVIGDISSDPIIVDVSDEETPIYLALHGVRCWELKKVADRFEDFISFLSCWIDNVINKYSNKLDDDDCVLQPKVLKEIKKCLSNSIDKEFHSNFLEFME